MASKFFQQVLDEMPEDVKIFSDKYEEITMRIYLLMKEKGMSQKALAEHLGKKPSEVSKWLHGGHNLTLKTIAKIEAVLNADIINVPKRRVFVSEDSKSAVRKNTFTVFKNEPSDRKMMASPSKFTAVESLAIEKLIVQKAI